MKLRDHIDPASLAIIVITFVMFAVALFVKGIGKDLLLEIGILLVSISLIMKAQKNSVTSTETKRELQKIKATIEAQESADGT